MDEDSRRGGSGPAGNAAETLGVGVVAGRGAAGRQRPAERGVMGIGAGQRVILAVAHVLAGQVGPVDEGLGSRPHQAPAQFEDHQRNDHRAGDQGDVPRQGDCSPAELRLAVQATLKGWVCQRQRSGFTTRKNADLAKRLHLAAAPPAGASPGAAPSPGAGYPRFLAAFRSTLMPRPGARSAPVISASWSSGA